MRVLCTCINIESSLFDDKLFVFVARQQCVINLIGVLTSETAYHQLGSRLEDILLRLIPLFMLGYYGNDASGRAAVEVAVSYLGNHHPLLEGLDQLTASDGKCLSDHILGIDLCIALSIPSLLPFLHSVAECIMPL